MLPSLFKQSQSPMLVVNPQPAASNSANSAPIFVNFNSFSVDYQVECASERLAGRLMVNTISATLALRASMFLFPFSVLLLTLSKPLRLMPVGHPSFQLFGRLCEAVACCNHIQRLLNVFIVNTQSRATYEPRRTALLSDKVSTANRKRKKLNEYLHYLLPPSPAQWLISILTCVQTLRSS